MRVFLFILFVASSVLAQAPAPARPEKFPPLRVQVAVGTAQRRIGDSYRKMMNIEPKVTIEGMNRVAAIPEAEATMVIVTMDTRAKYTAKKEVFNVHATETIPIPAAESGERRQFALAECTATFDAYRDNSNVGGAVYKYYVFALRDPESKQIIEFQTNNTQLAAFCKAHPEKRDDFLKIAKDAKFPTEFK